MLTQPLTGASPGPLLGAAEPCSWTEGLGLMAGVLVWRFKSNVCLSKCSEGLLPDAACNPLADPLIRGWPRVCAPSSHPSQESNGGVGQESS